MGQQILYCWKCNDRILGSELESGKAAQLGNRASCKKCLPDLIDTLQPDERQAYQSRQTALKTPPPTARVRLSSTTIRPPAERKSSHAGLIAAGVGGALAMLAVLVAVTSKPAKAPAVEAPPPAPVKATTAKAEPSPKEAGAREAVAKARAAGTVEAWQEAVFACEGTSKLDEAQRELAAAVSARAGAIEREFQALNETARAALRDEAYGTAIAALEEGKKRRTEPDWRLRIENRVAEIRASAAERLPILIQRATELKRREAVADLKEIEEQVARWGMSEHSDALREALAKVPAGKPYPQGADGFLVIEAERFHANVPQGGQAWTEVTSPAGGAGVAMRALPNKGSKFEKNYVSASPRMEYHVNFTKPGRHYVWARMQADISDDNTLTLGFEDRTVKTLESVIVKAGKEWRWTNALYPNGTAWVDIDRPGPRVLKVYVREDGIGLDRFVFTTDPDWKPEGRGPPESPR